MATPEEQQLHAQLAELRAELAAAEERQASGNIAERASAMADVMRIRGRIAVVEGRLAGIGGTPTTTSDPMSTPPPLPDLPIPGGSGPLTIPPSTYPAPVPFPQPTVDPWGPPALDGRVPPEVLAQAITEMQRYVDTLPVVQVPNSPAPTMIPRSVTGVLTTIGQYLLDRGQAGAMNWFLRWLHEDAEPEFDAIAREASGYSDGDCSMLYKRLPETHRNVLDAWWSRRTCSIAPSLLKANERELYMLLVVANGPPPEGCGCGPKANDVNLVGRAGGVRTRGINF